MKIPRLRIAVAAAAALAVLTTGCAGEEALEQGGGSGEEASGGGGPVIVGAVEFTENILLQEMYAQVLDDIGVDVQTKQAVASREVLFPAIQAGEVDLAPEYTGALATYVTNSNEAPATNTDELIRILRRELEPEIQVLEPAPAQDQDSLVVTKETARKYDLQTVSDLAGVADQLTIGGPPELRTRYAGLPGLEEVYGVTFADFRPLDAGGPLTVEALKKGDIDVGRFFSTQGVIDAEGWVVLKEDKELIPPENLVPVIRRDALTDEIETALNNLSAEITTEEITALNRQVDVDQKDPEAVAQKWLQDKGLID